MTDVSADAVEVSANTNVSPADEMTVSAPNPGPSEDDADLLSRAPRLHNRLSLVLAHTCRYAFEGQARLARDVGVSRSTISRLVGGRTRPLPPLMRRVTEALGLALGRPLPLRELFSPDGTYPTRSGCALCHCPGCIPEYAFDRFCERRPAYAAMRPGDWTLSPAMGDARPGHRYARRLTLPHIHIHQHHH